VTRARPAGCCQKKGSQALQHEGKDLHKIIFWSCRALAWSDGAEKAYVEGKRHIIALKKSADEQTGLTLRKHRTEKARTEWNGSLDEKPSADLGSRCSATH